MLQYLLKDAHSYVSVVINPFEKKNIRGNRLQVPSPHPHLSEDT
jgi:hypothetical protein